MIYPTNELLISFSCGEAHTNTMMLTHSTLAYDSPVYHQPSMYDVPDPIPFGLPLSCQPQTSHIGADFTPYPSRLDEFSSSTESFQNTWTPEYFRSCSPRDSLQSFGASPYSSCSSASITADIPFAYDTYNNDAAPFPSFDDHSAVGISYQTQRSCEFMDVHCGWDSSGLVTSQRRSPPSYTEHVTRMGCVQPLRGNEASWADDVTGADLCAEGAVSMATQNSHGIKQSTNLDSSSSLKHVLKFFGSVNSGSSHVQLWQFLLELLLDPVAHSHCIRWENLDEGEFQMVDPDKVAQKWGERKKRTNMNYDKMGRAMRYYYEKMILSKIPGKKCTYRFHVAGLMCQGRRTLGAKMVSF